MALMSSREPLLVNARRDDYLLQPAAVRGGYWDPVTGDTHAQPVVQPVRLTRKNARGRARIS